MRVLFITNLPSPYRVEFFNSLGKLCDLTVLYELRYAPDRNKKWKSLERHEFKEIFLDAKRMRDDTSLSFSILKYLNDSYDLIVIGVIGSPTELIAMEYLSLKRKKFILNSDGGFIKANELWIKKMLKKYFICKAAAYLSTAKKTTEHLVHYGAKVCNVYEYPFSSIKDEDILLQVLNRKEKIEIRQKLNLSEKKIIISVGRFIHIKGYDVLLDSCENIKQDVGVYIIGGVAPPEYIKLIEKNKLQNIHFVDFKTKKELTEYYKAADIFVLPTRGDTWGLVINEAMSYGLPMVTTDMCIAGLELIEDGQNGFVVPVDNAKILAEKINIILNDDELRGKMALNNLMKIREYTIENMARRHIEIFNHILSGWGGKKSKNVTRFFKWSLFFENL